eukprot:gnl/MRDRNA2_/MRDRNA2_111723_c0_seq1.p1 gnl/MRDRNA2_/MRDRNA2_111723_c0~~gnl/MRDRNA2_/MRDRNA2_111723_c0_seq1.p1  ORF type:complete len:538 (+),score=100.38 gnl/MRDRNA2_/MRDRNA2_111723_c0_seq1:83-1696(+)
MITPPIPGYGAYTAYGAGLGAAYGAGAHGALGMAASLGAQRDLAWAVGNQVLHGTVASPQAPLLQPAGYGQPMTRSSSWHGPPPLYGSGLQYTPSTPDQEIQQYQQRTYVQPEVQQGYVQPEVQQAWHVGRELGVESVALDERHHEVDKKVRVKQEVAREITKPTVVELRKEIIKPEVQYVDKFVEVPEIQYIEKIIEVPEIEYQEIVRPVIKREQQFVERFVNVPKIEYVERIVEVPEIQYVDKIVEVPQIQYQEVIKHVPKVQVQEVVRHIPKYETQYVETMVEVPEVRSPAQQHRVVQSPQQQHRVVQSPPQQHRVVQQQPMQRQLPKPLPQPQAMLPQQQQPQQAFQPAQPQFMFIAENSGSSSMQQTPSWPSGVYPASVVSLNSTFQRASPSSTPMNLPNYYRDRSTSAEFLPYPTSSVSSAPPWPPAGVSDPLGRGWIMSEPPHMPSTVSLPRPSGGIASSAPPSLPSFVPAVALESSAFQPQGEVMPHEMPPPPPPRPAEQSSSWPTASEFGVQGPLMSSGGGIVMQMTQ